MDERKHKNTRYRSCAGGSATLFEEAPYNHPVIALTSFDHFGRTSGFPPGVPGGGITGVLLVARFGGVTTFRSALGGGCMTPPD